MANAEAMMFILRGPSPDISMIMSDPLLTIDIDQNPSPTPSPSRPSPTVSIISRPTPTIQSAHCSPRSSGARVRLRRHGKISSRSYWKKLCIT